MSICCCPSARPLHDDDRPVLHTKVTIKTGRKLPSAQEFNPGDLFYQYDDGKLYYYDNKREAYTMLTLTDFATNCIEECAARPTFINCRNCGAPVRRHQCEYCGTRY